MKTYFIAFAKESGEWDITARFGAESDDAANTFAEKYCKSDDWYVLNERLENINGGE